MVEAIAARKDEADALERATMRRVAWRLLPMLMLCYFSSYLDRVNVGFAALTMNKALGFSATLFGFGSGIFFIGYFIFEVPSNLILAKIGARAWISRILVTWGLVSALTAAVVGAKSFIAIRFMLGLAEAGFFPGVILYLTWWFPSSYRSRIIAMFMAAIPLSQVFGSLVSGMLLNLNGAGLAGWQWLFIIEAAPSVILGVAFYFYMTDRPEGADWLKPAERAWLIERLDSERRRREAVRRYGLGQALRNRRVLLLALVYFGGAYANVGLILFQPQIVHRLAFGFGMTGAINAIPYVFAAIAMVFWGRHSDRTGERTGHAATAYLLASTGLIACAMMSDPVLTMTMLVIASVGVSSAAPVFWSLPTAFLSGAAAAGGAALINALGTLGGFFGPYVFGLIKDHTGNYTFGLIALAAGPILSAIVVLLLGHDRRLEGVPTPRGEGSDAARQTS